MKCRRSALGISLTALACASCGAENLVAPPANEGSQINECRGFDQLMPNFLRIINEGRTQNLKRLVETQLLRAERDDLPPPINEVLRTIFEVLSVFAHGAKEPGAMDGEVCAPSSSPPPLSSANELCEMRRAIDLLVHQGKGIDAFNLLQPQLLAVLNYLSGTGDDCRGRPRTAHFEVAGLVSQFCTRSGNCRLTDGLDLTIALTAYVNIPQGKALVAHLTELLSKPSVVELLNPQSLSEADLVAIVKNVVVAIQGGDVPALRKAFDTLPLPAQVKMDLQPIVADLEELAAHPEVMTPLRRSLSCLTTEDQNFELVRMVHRLGIQEQCPGFDLQRLNATFKGLQEVDRRGSLVFLLGRLAKAVRDDELAVDSAAMVCRTLFSSKRAFGAQSNAELALPVAADLVEAGIIGEGICALDSLIYGCSGGALAACP